MNVLLEQMHQKSTNGYIEVNLFKMDLNSYAQSQQVIWKGYILRYILLHEKGQLYATFRKRRNLMMSN